MIAIVWHFDVKSGKEPAFEKLYGAEGAIDALEQKRDALIQSVEPLGVFTALDVPDRTGPTWSQRKGVKR